MRRKPIQSPLECFALEYSPKAKICLRCEFQGACRALVKNPDSVSVAEIKFDLIPDASRIRKSVEVGDTVAAAYARAYRKVFGLNSKPDRPKPDVCAAISKKAVEHGCTPEIFCLIPMITRDATGEKFFAAMLKGAYADNAVEAYFSALAQDHRRIDLEVIQQLTGVGVKDRDFVSRFIKAEITLGTAVIGAFEKGLQSKKKILADCFETIDPIWQAVYQTDFELGRDAARFRITFKKNSSIAAQAFLAWQTAMPTAIDRVLSARGFSATDFNSQIEVYKDTYRFWSVLGYAFQHLHAISLIQKGSIKPYGTNLS